MGEPLKVYFVVGEESGDALGARLIKEFSDLGHEIEPVGLAGSRMQAQGMTSLFDISDISVMGITGVAAQLPRLLKRMRETIKDVAAHKPDVLLLIDSPEFSYRVARAARKSLPDVKIIKYVAPSVWAWRPARAAKIKPYVDHILAILPFEPDILKELGGPDATYVGHPLGTEIPEISAEDKLKVSTPLRIVALPGSRRGEIKRLMPVLQKTLTIMKARGNDFEIVLPAVQKLEQEVRDLATQWPVMPRIVVGDSEKTKAFQWADIALAASGTVTLELALYKVPTISIYKLDTVAMRIRHWLTGWTASLPNLIADYPIVPEKFNEYAHPEYIARMVERLARDDHERQLQLKGFELVEKKMRQETPALELAVQTIMKVARSSG